MGTNYYMSTKDKLKRDKWFNIGEYTLTDHPDWGYEIHVCKMSGGWKPLFQAHDKVHSFAVYKAIYEEGGWRMYDEYGKEIAIEDFEHLAGSWSQKQEKSHLSSLAYRNYGCFKDHENYEFIKGDFG